jgi:WD40 repeat protein
MDIAALPNNELAIASDIFVFLWNMKTNTTKSILKGHKKWVNSLKLFPNGDLVSSSQDSIIIWDLTSKIIKKTLDINSSIVQYVLTLPNNDLVIKTDDTCIIWDVKNATTKFEISDKDVAYVYIVQQSTGNLIGASTNLIKIWDTNKGAIIKEISIYLIIHSINLISEEKLAVGSDNLIAIFNLSTGRSEKVLINDFQLNILSLLVLPNGNLVSGSGDSIIRVWNISSDKPQTTLKGHKKGVNSLALLENGNVVSASFDTVKIWNKSLFDSSQFIN